MGMDDFVSSHEDRRSLAVPVHGFEDGAVYDAEHSEVSLRERSPPWPDPRCAGRTG